VTDAQDITAGSRVALSPAKQEKRGSRRSRKSWRPNSSTAIAPRWTSPRRRWAMYRRARRRGPPADAKTSSSPSSTWRTAGGAPQTALHAVAACFGYSDRGVGRSSSGSL